MKYFFLCLLFLTRLGLLFSQDELAPAASPPVPTSYRGLSLGMGLADLKDALKQDALFNFRESDVSLIPTRDQDYVETRGTSFIRRALFQIKDEKVFAMTFTMDTAYIDYYSIYSSLSEKYGAAQSLDPKQAVWEDEATRLTLERPLSLQYLDKAVFAEIIEKAQATRNEDLEIRSEFLNDF